MATRRDKAARVTDKSGETQRRILATSRQLFNRQGVKSTAVLKIAYELGMSPGNLTYHFKNKSDIVLELASELQREVESAIYEMQSPLDAGQVIAHLEMVLRALWSYRFVFNSALHVSRLDDAAADVVDTIKRTIVDMLYRYFSSTVERGEMRAPRQADGLLMLSENILAIWLQWLLAESIAHPSADEPSRAGLHNCMRHHFSLIDPYVSGTFAAKSAEEIARRFA